MEPLDPVVGGGRGKGLINRRSGELNGSHPSAKREAEQQQAESSGRAFRKEHYPLEFIRGLQDSEAPGVGQGWVRAGAGHSLL